MIKLDRKSKILHIKQGFYYALYITIAEILLSIIMAIFVTNENFSLLVRFIIATFIIYYLSYLAIVNLEKVTKEISPDWVTWSIFVFFLILDRVYIIGMNILTNQAWYQGLKVYPGILVILMPLIVPIIYDKMKIKKGEP